MGTSRQASTVGQPSTADSAAAPDRPEHGARDAESVMDVYFIPVAPDRYELYCEHDDNANEVVDDMPPKGRLAKLYANFKDALARVEQERLSGEKRVDEGPRSWTERLKDRALCWIAEKIAEQRLLWRLRNETELVLHYPDDMPVEDVIALARA